MKGRQKIEKYGTCTHLMKHIIFECTNVTEQANILAENIKDLLEWIDNDWIDLTFIIKNISRTSFREYKDILINLTKLARHMRLKLYHHFYPKR